MTSQKTPKRLGHASRARTARPSSGPRRSRRVLAGATALACLLLVGCGRIPTDGPVYHYAESSPSSSGSASPAYNPQGPADGASPEDILRGFIEAGTGVDDDYSTAREFLTSDLAGHWKPEGRTLVYQDDLSVGAAGSADTYTAKVSVGTQIDGRGIATSYDDPKERTVQAEFRKVNGQWRISAVPDGTLLSRSQFEQLFRAYTLYFYDPTYSYAVPDIRWMANRSKVSTSIVQALLQGPAPYLSGAVVSPIPQGTTLQRSSVPISNETAEVPLTGEGVSHLNDVAVDRMNAQFQQTLETLGNVNNVTMSVGNKKLDTGKSDDFRTPVVNPEVSDRQVGVADGHLATYSDGETSEVTGLDDVHGTPRLPAASARLETYAWLNQDRSKLSVRGKNHRSHDLDLPGASTRPSIDPRQWVWTATTQGKVSAVLGTDNDADLVDVKAPWLDGQAVQSLRVSRDGTRVLVVTGEGRDARVWAAGIDRGKDGRPESLQEPLRVGTTLNASQAEWVSEDTVVVVDREDSSVQTVSLSGEINDVNGLSGIQSVSAGNGVKSIYGQTQADTFLLSGTSWSRTNTQIRDLSYPG